jgi:AcrR family transcriptional regulator
MPVVTQLSYNSYNKNTGRKSQKRKSSEDRIFRSAVSVLAKKGYHNTRITDIANHAGVAYGLVYHYFGSKQNILEVILNEFGLRFNERLDRIASEEGTVREKLCRISDYMFDSYLANQDMIHLLVNEVVHGPGTTRGIEIASELIGRISRMIREGVQDGELHPELEPQVIALTFFGSVQMLLTSLVAGYYDRQGQNRNAIIKSLKRQVRLLIQSGNYGRL